MGHGYLLSRGCSIGGGLERGGDLRGIAKLEDFSRWSVMGWSFLDRGGASCSETMEKLPSGSACAVEYADGRTIGIGRGKKSPVVGFALTSSLIPGPPWNRIGSTGLPGIGDGEKRLPRWVGAVGCARRTPDTSKKSVGGGRITGSLSHRISGTSSSLSSSSLELSLLSTINSLASVAKCA